MDSYEKLRLPRIKKSVCGLTLELASKLILLGHAVFVAGFFLYIFVQITMYEYKWYKKGRVRNNDFRVAFLRDEYFFSMVVSQVIYAICSFFGVLRKDGTLFQPWLLLKTIFFLMNFVYLFFFIYERTKGYKQMEIFFLLGYMAFDAYMMLIVYNFYKQVHHGSEETNE